MHPTDALRSALGEVLPAVRADLERLVRIRSVSADPSASECMRASADEVAAQLHAAGLRDVQVLQVAGGQPAVLGHRPAAPGRPTVLLYAHHDVQPPGDERDWDTDPFEPAERDGRLYARGAADDKAGVALHCAALRALDTLGDDLGLGVTVLVEGEEEVGSPTLPAFLDSPPRPARRRRDRAGRLHELARRRTRTHDLTARRRQRRRGGADPAATPCTTASTAELSRTH